MPSTDDFSLRLLVGGSSLPEYTVGSRTYVECVLTSPVSYNQVQAETVGGEVERQELPVTPYRVEVTCKSNTDPKYFRILVDGVKVKAVSILPNEKKVIKGFRDGAVIREFLFSMPRFATDIEDRLDDGRVHEVGTIEVECWDAELKSSGWKVREKQLNFIQANKKDSTKVTNGEYTMATSKVGRAIAERSVLRRVDSWKRVRLRSAAQVHYRMGHTLQELGVDLKPLPAPVVTATTDTKKAEVKEEPGDRAGIRVKRTCVIDLTLSSSGDDSEGTPLLRSKRRRKDRQREDRQREGRQERPRQREAAEQPRQREARKAAVQPQKKRTEQKQKPRPAEERTQQMVVESSDDGEERTSSPKPSTSRAADPATNTRPQIVVRSSDEDEDQQLPNLSSRRSEQDKESDTPQPRSTSPDTEQADQHSSSPKSPEAERATSESEDRLSTGAQGDAGKSSGDADTNADSETGGDQQEAAGKASGDSNLDAAQPQDLQPQTDENCEQSVDKEPTKDDESSAKGKDSVSSPDLDPQDGTQEDPKTSEGDKASGDRTDSRDQTAGGETEAPHNVSVDSGMESSLATEGGA